MTASKILTVDMDVHAEPIAEHAARHPQHPIDKYAALGGMRPGMVAGPKTDLPIPAPEPAESLWHALKPGLFGAGSFLAFLLLVAGLALVLSALVGGVLR